MFWYFYFLSMFHEKVLVFWCSYASSGDGSYITEVEPYAFYGLSAFTGGSYGLSFDGNPLTTLHSGSFYGLENLVKLEL